MPVYLQEHTFLIAILNCIASKSYSQKGVSVIYTRNSQATKVQATIHRYHDAMIMGQIRSIINNRLSNSISIPSARCKLTNIPGLDHLE